MLKTDYKDAIFPGQRRYDLVKNEDSTTSLIDKTDYTQSGDQFGANDINATNEVVNNLNDVELPALKKSVSDGKASVAAAITLKKVAAAATDTFAQLAAKIGQIVLGSGNATAADVAAGKTFTNSTGVEQTGAMPYRNVDYNLPINGSYNIAAGQHGGDGWVRQVITTLGAQTLYPGTTAKTLACTSRYMTGNVTVAAVSIAAAYIKKGQVITLPDGSTVTGTWEGYVATATDLYYLGVNSAGLYDSNPTSWWAVAFESTFIRAVAKSQNNRLYLSTTKNYQFAGYSSIQITIYNVGVVGQLAVELYDTSGNLKEEVIQSGITKGTTFTISIPLVRQQTSFIPRFVFRVYLTSSTYGEIQIQRIRLV